MELYIRFEPEGDLPQPIEGVLSWTGLGTRTKIVGSMTERGINFREAECLAGNCGKIVLGGNYQASFSKNRTHLSGKAVLKSRGLSGSFELKKTKLR
ncbi:MAG: hypothetical protein KDD66_14845 [Bdellovibrionales bacterium]|nr:hypothetical protein [Bdellovibrionales bacterium]